MKYTLKVCGMRDRTNIIEVAALMPGFIGFVFFPASPRYAGDCIMDDLSVEPIKTGVFVNSPVDEILAVSKQFGLGAVQLHGNESTNVCQTLKQAGFVLIKAFSVSMVSDFNRCDEYAGCCDYFLFDTATEKHGGSGIQFDWFILDNYAGKLPFFLSGGISVADAGAIKRIQHPQLFGIDINSRFEIEPGIKDISLIKKFIDLLS